MYLSGEEIHVTDHLADTCTDHGLVFERANNCTAQGIVCLDCSGGIGISAFGNVDNYNITITNFVVKRVVSANVNIGIDFGTFAPGFGELQNITFANGLVDTRGNAGSNPAIAAFSGNGQAGILPTVHTITNISAANPAHVTSAGHGLSNGATIEIFNVRGPDAVNARWVVTVLDGNTFTIPLNTTSLPAYVATSGYWQTQGRTRNVHLRNIHVLQDGATSLGAFFANLDGFTLENCTINSQDASPVSIDGYCSNIRLAENVFYSGAAHTVIVSGGTYRSQFDDNIVHGKDGTTVHGIFFFNTSFDVYARHNIVTGSSISGTGVNTEGTTVISYTEVDLLSAQTVGGAKTWTADATFNGKIGMGVVPSGSVELSVKGGNSTSTIDLVNPASGTWGMTFAGGLYGQITADLLSSNGLIISAFDNIRIGQASSFGLGGFTQIGRFDVTNGLTLSKGFTQSGGPFSLTGNSSSNIVTTTGNITVNGAQGVKLQYNGIDRVSARSDNVAIQMDGYDIITVYDGYTLLKDQFGNTCMQIIPNAIGFDPGVEIWAIGSQVTLFGLVHFQREGTGNNPGAGIVIQAQDGQDQTGVNNNNKGGNIKLQMGVQGTGGSGADGVPGTLEISDHAPHVASLITIPHAQYSGYDSGKVLTASQDGNTGEQVYISIDGNNLHIGDAVNGDDLIFDAPANKIIHFRINSQDAMTIDQDKISAGVSTFQFSETSFSATIWQPQQGGTGFNSGASMIVQAQDGQNQTGGNNNNDGGSLTIRSGSAGAGGGGADGNGGGITIAAGNG
ncbi:MAG TPA: hypothetical protein VM577_21325, partial [Anaerovoracaceae bacterium]|nr:hypothetical protein [Anaerovoracaceae bacterium]